MWWGPQAPRAHHCLAEVSKVSLGELALAAPGKRGVVRAGGLVNPGTRPREGSRFGSAAPLLWRPLGKRLEWSLPAGCRLAQQVCCQDAPRGREDGPRVSFCCQHQVWGAGPPSPARPRSGQVGSLPATQGGRPLPPPLPCGTCSSQL